MTESRDWTGGHLEPGIGGAGVREGVIDISLNMLGSSLTGVKG